MSRPRHPPPDWAAGFPPVEPRRARVLVLGSLPGIESIRRGEYYAHPRNAFWPIMGALFGAGPARPYPERVRILAAQGVMLWDVLKAARRAGSLDTAILSGHLVPNDIPAQLARHPELQRIAFNGGAAETLFRRFIQPACSEPMLAVERVRLPSTSPAHAARTQKQKLVLWRKALQP